MSVTAAEGFVASGLHAGIKKSRHDMALLATGDRKPVPCGAVFTQNKFAAPPVELDRGKLADNGGLVAAIVVNSGNANAGTGRAGYADAAAMGNAAATAAGALVRHTLVCSTGIIGTPLPMDTILAAIPALAERLSRDGGDDAALGILTTDSKPKQALVRGSTFTLGGMAKGCGMIAPNMATMLAFSPPTRRRAPGTPAHPGRRFRSHVQHAQRGRRDIDQRQRLPARQRPARARRSRRAGRRVHALCEDLTASDGARCGRHDQARPPACNGRGQCPGGAIAAKSIAENNLVKCSWYGSDPYWGRLLAAAGSAGIAFETARSAVAYGGILVAEAGAPLPHDADAVAAHMANTEIEIEVSLGVGSGEARMIGIDLGPGYIKENSVTVMTPTHTARVLVQALPYIRRFAGKSVVVKLGGAAIDAELDRALAQDVLLLRSVGVRVVLVHGGGPQVDAMMRRVGKEPEFRDGLRVTDAETLEIVRMVLVGKINRDLVATINREALEEPWRWGVRRGCRPADRHAARSRARLCRRCLLRPRLRAAPSARRGLGPRCLHDRRRRGRTALQHQRGRGGARDRGRDGRREDRLSHRRSGPASRCERPGFAHPATDLRGTARSDRP
jgi:glutamate N-acetyltransferase/amino-acid N-acetyltransferase